MSLIPWTFPPDWAQPMLERLEWRTDVIQARRAEEQRRALRLGPRQVLEFGLTAELAARRHLEAVLWSNGGAGEWAVPLWFDGLDLAAPLDAGATAIPLDPALRQFTVGDYVLLLGRDTRTFELIEIASVAGAIGLADPTTLVWPAGTVAYPARRARIDGEINLSLFHGQARVTRVRFECIEPAAWAASAGATTYRGHPVFDLPPVWIEDPGLSLEQQLAVLDAGTGPVDVEDLAELPIPRQTGRFTLLGRAEIDAWRQRLFALRGRQVPLWVPSWGQDLALVATAGAADTTLDVEWAGVTEHLFGDPNRRDIQIELHDGTVYRRRITGAEEISSSVERLTIDSALGAEVLPAEVAAISWLVLMRQESDAAEIAWWTGEVVDTVGTFRGFRHGE